MFADFGDQRGNTVRVAEVSHIDAGLQYDAAEFGTDEADLLHRVHRVEDAPEILTAVLSQLVAGLRSDKDMRWNDPSLSFSRPIRWLLALLEDTVLPVTAGALTAGRITRNHRQSDRPEITIDHAADYNRELRVEGILIDHTERRETVVQAVAELAREDAGVIDVENESGLIDEITNLVEIPFAILGRFDQKYLDLPEQILTTVMRKHQRYLPVRTNTGTLLPLFATVANGACDPDVVRDGNEKVLRARFEDAAFFWNTDLNTAPEEFRARLTTLTFEQRLGSMADRANRIATGSRELTDRITLSAKDSATLARAGELVKFDLATQMVVEMTSLAGTMAREYARKAGEPTPVAEALLETELPRHHTDQIPVTLPGALLALADRFDLLVAMLAVGAKLTGTSDPYGLRRAALGIVRILRAHPELETITYRDGLNAAAQALRDQGIEVPDRVLDTAEELLTTRYQQRLRDENTPSPLIDAVRLAADNPRHADRLRDEIEQSSQHPRPAVRRARRRLQRIVRILPSDTPADYDTTRLSELPEQQLTEVIARLDQAQDQPLPEWVETATPLAEALRVFFDDVLVMVDEPDIRSPRLGLLATVLAVAPSRIDWKALHLMRSDRTDILLGTTASKP
ncbi:glycine--tRNA ligase subunit beta [Nocardia sp. NPDC051052]|uniref:glycine--tRNA ligase subunit beta n=1 Tax=Nocardia sp. NPDC051052 TaxID=3364322 RepID=UPI003793C133